jgi:type III secretory pathway lipoprotein EscJ
MGEEELGIDAEDEEIEEEIEEEELKPEKSGFFSKKRILIIVGIIVLVALVGGGLFAFKMVSTPKSQNGVMSPQQKAEQAKKEAKKKKKKIEYVPLYSEVTPEQATEIIRYLSYMRIAYQTSGSSDAMSVVVDETQLDRAKSQLAIKGIPAGAPKGYSLLDSGQTLGVTEFDKRIRFLRALSGELEKAVMQFEMIETCKVQIVLPEQRLFAVTQPPVTASILIRKRPGVDLTDEVVFSIIQLVSNAVENLQPENVSVITTEGKVLSRGIFERMAAKEAGIIVEEPGVEDTDTPSTENMLAFGQAFVPDFSDIKKWYEIKNAYEIGLTEKAERQITGILPEGSFKIAISADLGPIENGEIVNIERLSASVVINSSNDDVYLDEVLKKQIFSALAGAMGFVKGRDIITINTADFAIKTKPSRVKLFIGKWGKVFSVVLGVLVGLVLLIMAKNKFVSKKDTTVPGFMNDSADEDEDDLFQTTSTEDSVIETKNIVNENPDIVAELIEEWLGNEKVGGES